MNSIRARLTFAIVALILLSVSIMGSVSYWNAKNTIIREMENSLTLLSRDNAEKLGMWVAERKSEVAFLANSPLVDEVAGDTAMNYLKDENKRNPLFQSFMMANAKGDAIFTTGQKASLAERPYFRPVMEGKTVMSNPVVAKDTGTLVVVPVTPVSRNGTATGILGGAVTLADVIKLVGQIKAGDTGYAYVVQSDGLIIFHPDTNMAMKFNGLTDAASPQTLKDITSRMVKGEQGITQYSFDGVAKYIAFAPIPGTSWSLAVNVPAREVLSKLDTLMWTSLGIALIVLVVSVLVSFYIAASFTRPLNVMKTMLQDIANGGGDLTRRIAISGKDEIAETARHFNTFLEVLRGMFADISRQAATLTEGVHSTNQTLGRIAGEFRELADQSSSNAATIEEITVSVAHIADNAGEADSLVKDTSQLSVESAQTVAEVSSKAEQSAN